MQTTWTPHEKHGQLTGQGDLPDTVYAFPKQRKEPLTDAAHVRNAVARFDQVTGVSDAERALAFANIEKAARHYDVDLSETSWRDLGAHRRPAERGRRQGRRDQAGAWAAQGGSGKGRSDAQERAQGVKRPEPQAPVTRPPPLVSERRPRYLLWPDSVGGALNERLDLFKIRRLQLAGKVRHAHVGKLVARHGRFQIGDQVGVDITQIWDVAAVVDARDAVAEQAIAYVEPASFTRVFGMLISRPRSAAQACNAQRGGIWRRRRARRSKPCPEKRDRQRGAFLQKRAPADGD